MNLKFLETFVWVARLKSFRLTADKLFTTQASISSRIAVLVDLSACDWKDTDFFSLALQAGERFQRDDQVLTLFTYDLLDYKQVPDWLNARFWANPENFGKYWW